MDNLLKPEKICQIITALITQDQILFETFISPDFLIHEGMDRESYIAHELEMYRELAPVYQLHKGFNVSIQKEKDNHYSIILVNVFNEISAEWIQVFDHNGLILGNGSKCQSISKIQTYGGEQVRSIAFQSPVPIVSVRPQFGCEYINYHFPENPADFWNFVFVPENEDNQTHFLTFKIRYKDGSIELKEIWCRGLDRLFLHRPQLILSEDGLTLTHNSPRPWGISVKYENHQTEKIEFPTEFNISFAQPVTWLCLTDARDFDWVVTREHFSLLA